MVFQKLPDNLSLGYVKIFGFDFRLLILQLLWFYLFHRDLCLILLALLSLLGHHGQLVYARIARDLLALSSSRILYLQIHYIALFGFFCVFFSALGLAQVWSCNYRI